jgi:acetyltransferase-like isoleucine patch superfamily enzyme
VLDVRKLRLVIGGELYGVRPRLWALNLLTRLLPLGVGSRTRAMLYRLWGVSIGQGTCFVAPLNFGWWGDVFRNLSVGRSCFFSGDVFIDTTARVTVGDRVTFGHQVAVITTSHDVSAPGCRAGAVRPKPVTIGNGVWIASRATILPGVTIHDGAVVAAGAVVARDVPTNTLVGGIPARVLRVLNGKPARDAATAGAHTGYC